MPFFFILPLWALVAVIGIVLLFLPRFRSTGVYVLVSSTGGLLLSFFLSTCVLMLVPRLQITATSRWLLIFGYLGAILFGGLAGIVLGFLLARPIVRRMTPVPSGQI